MIVRMAARLALITLALAAAIVPLPLWAVERWYSTGLYPAFQPTVTRLTNQVPVAILDIGVAAVVVLGIWRFARVRLTAYRLPGQNRISARFLGSIQCAG